MIKYLCDICKKEMKHETNEYKLKSKDNEIDIYVSFVFSEDSKHSNNNEFFCSKCVKEILANIETE